MMKTTTYFIIGILAVTSVIGCKKHKAATGAMPVPEIQVATPVVQEVTYTYEYPAYLQAEQTVNLVARISGFLEQVLFVPGQSIKSGELLFVIEPKPYVDQVNTAEAMVKSAEAKLAYTQASYNRMKDAVETKAVSEIDYIQSESAYKGALATLQDAKAQLNSASIHLGYCYIKAPFDGRMTRNMADCGNFVGGAAQPETLATLYRDRRMFVYFNMSYTEYQELSQGVTGVEYQDSIRIRDVANPDKSWPGKLDYASPNVDLETGTVNLRAIVENPRQELRSGMYVKITVPYKNVKNAILIPESSIGTNQSGRFVYVVNKDNVIDLKPVKVGVSESNGLRQIVAGVAATDRYAVDALMGVRPGSHVKPQTGK